MSRSSATVSPSTAVDAYVRRVLPTLKQDVRVPDWAREHARDYFHTVCRQPGFLPVYHALYNAGYARQAEIRKASVAQRAPVQRQNALAPASVGAGVKTPTRPTTRSAPATATTTPTVTREQIFAQSWPSFDNFSDMNAWARAHARNYFHQLNGTRTFRSIFDELIEDAENHMVETGSQVDDETLTYTSEEEEETEPTFATDGRPTRAEVDAGQKALNAICFRQARIWYSAFKEEEKEGDSDMTADERFALHVGRIFRNKTQLPLDKCERVAAGWIHMNKKYFV